MPSAGQICSLASPASDEASGASYYARSKSLCPDHYQELMDRGWRRSGTLLYLPDVSRSCCPHYTIRLPASEFRASRDQRQSLNRWNRFVLGEAYTREVNRRHPQSRAEKKRASNEFALIDSVHESESSHLKPGIEPDHRLEVTLETDVFTEEKFALFDNYQRHVHHEGDADISRQGFRRFLCSSPLHRHGQLARKKLGSFHQCYRLDGRLIAMSVLDLLPHAVSGVYFLYHSDFEKWSFGKLSALREAALALEMGYDYYYMGYYIHGCKKMRYKGDYKPQYVLDYNNFHWDVMDEGMRSLMEKRKWASLSRERERSRCETALDQDAMHLDDRRQTNGESHGTAASEEDEVLHPAAMDAMQSSLSLLDLGMPGVMTTHQMRAHVDLDKMRVFLGPRSVHEMQDIVVWDDGAENDPTSIKGIIAEFAAAVGPTVARDVTVDLSR